MLRVIKYFLALLLLVIISAGVGGLVIAWYYQDQVRDLMIRELNRHIMTEVRVGDVSFSVIKKFPHASVEFRDVLVRVPEDFEHNGTEGVDSDTLFTANSLFLKFNIRDIFRQEYKITSILAVNGVLYLAVNTDEQENYRFWKRAEAASDEFNLDLQDLRLNNYHLIFANSINEVYLDLDITRLYMSGNFSQSSYGIRGGVTGKNRSFRYQGFSPGGGQDIKITAALNVDNEFVLIEGADIDISGIEISTSGGYIIGEPGNIDIELTGRNLDTPSLIPLMSEKIREDLKPYTFEGKIGFDASVSGNISKVHSPSVIASFYAENGEIIRKDTEMRMSGINFSGYYTNGTLRNTASSKVVIDNFYSVFGKGSLSGSGTFSNPDRPEVDLDIEASLFLEELAEFYKPDNINQMSGRVNTVFSLMDRLHTPVKWDIEEFNRMDLNGTMEIENGLLEISEGRYIASSIAGKLSFGNALATDGLSFNIGRDHFSISGEISNGLQWLLGDDKVMSISGSLHSRNINLDNYILPASGSQEGHESQQLLFPPDMELNLDFLVDQLKFRNFSSYGFKGKLSYKPKMLVLNAVEFDAMDGNFSGNGVIVQRINGNFVVQSQTQLQDVDIQKMFYSFNNFGQKFINDENLSGRLTGSLGFISEWSSGLGLISEKIVADSKVEIKDGELIDFEPMLGLARFIDVSELQHIRFSTLNNEIFIRNKVVTIPQMDIHSSAFNISGSGTHNFDGQFSYRLRVLLSDVLYGKARRTKPENQEFGIVEDDGLGRTSLYLLVSGRSDDYSVSYDSRAVRDVIRENIANERNQLKQLFNEEFGWFTPDSSSVTHKENESGPGFRITWDEEDEKPSTESKPAERTGKNRERKFKIIWDEEEERSRGSEPEKPTER
ncbi:MAG: AsmA-like C-terminal region-containing protein [Bacteroidales bacterium]